MADKTPLELLEEKRAARKASLDSARAEQYLKDLIALNALEEELGDGSVASLEVDKYVPGQPTLVAIKAPASEYYKRFCQQVRKAGQNLEARGAAQDLLADSCWIYPAEKAEKDSMLAAFPGLRVSIAIRAAKMAELKADDEGKG